MKHRVGSAVCLCVLLAASTGFSKDVMRGVIRDAEGKPVPGVVVSIAKWGYETLTDQEGFFVIPCVEGPLAIDCRSARVPKWCWSQCRYSKTLRKDDCDMGWGEIRLRGIFLGDEEGEERWLFKDNTCAFTDNMDGTMTDCRTGLMWAIRSPADSMGITGCWTWDEAKTYCHKLESAGYTDWELPSPAQLESLPSPGMDGGPIGTFSSWWSSSLTGEDTALVLRRGKVMEQNRMSRHGVLPVRQTKE